MEQQLLGSVMESKIGGLLEANMELGKELLGKAKKGQQLTKAERSFVEALAELGGAMMVIKMFGGLHYE